jgi:hypothetical protein
MRAAVSDDMSHTPWRQKWEIQSGLCIAQDNAVIPTVAEVAAAPNNRGRPITTIMDVTVNTATNRFTSGSSHYLLTGDKVLVSADTLPTGISGTQYYRVVRNSATVVTLQNWDTGAIIDVTSTGTNVALIPVIYIPRVLPTALSVTVDHTAETLTTAADVNYFVPGDIVRVRASTLPGTLSATTRYVISSLGGEVYQLFTEDTGALVTFSSNGTAVNLVLVEPAAETEAWDVVNIEGISGLHWYPGTEKPYISNVE